MSSSRFVSVSVPFGSNGQLWPFGYEEEQEARIPPDRITRVIVCGDVITMSAVLAHPLLKSSDLIHSIQNRCIYFLQIITFGLCRHLIRANYAVACLPTSKSIRANCTHKKKTIFSYLHCLRSDQFHDYYVGNLKWPLSIAGFCLTCNRTQVPYKVVLIFVQVSYRPYSRVNKSIQRRLS